MTVGWKTQTNQHQSHVLRHCWYLVLMKALSCLFPQMFCIITSGYLQTSYIMLKSSSWIILPCKYCMCENGYWHVFLSVDLSRISPLVSCGLALHPCVQSGRSWVILFHTLTNEQWLRTVTWGDTLCQVGGRSWILWFMWLELWSKHVKKKKKSLKTETVFQTFSLIIRVSIRLILDSITLLTRPSKST